MEYEYWWAHRKGAFILTADGKRKNWDVSGPHFGGWEMYHLKGSPVDPNRMYASQTSGWFGQLIQRSNDGGKTWEPVNNKFVYDGVPGTHQWYDGTPHPWEFKRVWHLEPSLTDPDTVYAGVEDAALFRSTDGGTVLAGAFRLAQARDRAAMATRRRRTCVCTQSCSTRAIRRACIIAISAAGAFRTDDGGKTWKPINRGLHSQYIPDPNAEVGHCVHRIAMHPSRPNVLVHAEALGRHAQRQWRRLVAGGQRKSADRFRIRDRCARARTGNDLRRADQERLRTLIRWMESCRSIAAAPAATSGSR